MRLSVETALPVLSSEIKISIDCSAMASFAVVLVCQGIGHKGIGNEGGLFSSPDLS